MKYIKSLDTLRAISVFIVVFHHLPVLPFATPLSSIFNGITGVDIFFIISGFLITTILLQAKQESSNLWFSLKSFYIRRFLRIFPLYYSVIILLYILNPHNYRNDFIYDLLYVSNFYMGYQGNFTSVTPHFWSLAVEEQFYLFWPLLIFILPKRKEWIMFWVVFMAGIISYVYFIKHNPFFGARTFVNLSYLSAGAIWAYIKITYSDLTILKRFSLIFIIIFIFFGTFLFFNPLNLNNHFHKLINFLFCWSCVIYFSLSESSLLHNKLLVYLGKISYGIYVFHFLMIFPVAIVFKYTFPEVLHNLYLSNLFKIIFCVMVSIFSWHFFESRILKLKEKFTYISNKQ
jgi:peptidoglycan/LPS O-acetylase OafA/YrhL